MTRPLDDNLLESLLNEALAPEVMSESLTERILAHPCSPVFEENAQRFEGQTPRSFEGLLDQSLGTLPAADELMERIMDKTGPRAAGVIAKIGPVVLHYHVACRIAAAVVFVASLGVVMQAWGIGSDAYQIVQASRQMASLIQYVEPRTPLDQQMDILSVQIDQLARGDDWEGAIDDLDQMLMGLEMQLGTASNQELF